MPQQSNHNHRLILMQHAFLQSYRAHYFKMAHLTTLHERVVFLETISKIFVEQLIHVLTVKDGVKDFNKLIRNFMKQGLHFHLKTMYNFINQVNPDRFEQNRLLVTNLLFQTGQYAKLVEFIQPACLNDLMPCVQIQGRQYTMLQQIGKQHQNISSLIESVLNFTREVKQGNKINKLVQLRRQVLQFLSKDKNIDGITFVLMIIVEYTYTERHLGAFTLMEIVQSCKFVSRNESWGDEFMMARNSFFSAMATQYFGLKEYQNFFDDKRKEPFLLQQQDNDFQ